MDRAFAVLNSEYKWDITPIGLEEVREMREKFRDYLLVLYEPEQHSSRYMPRRIAFQRVQFLKIVTSYLNFQCFKHFHVFKILTSRFCVKKF